MTSATDIGLLILSLFALALSIGGAIKGRMLITMIGQLLGVTTLFLIALQLQV